MKSLDIYDIDIIPLDNFVFTGVISIDYVRSNDNILDMLTKELNRASRKIIEGNEIKAHRIISQ